MIGRGNGAAVSVFLIFPRAPTRGAGISTWHPAGFGGTGCYGVKGPDPSAVLDKSKRRSDYLQPDALVNSIVTCTRQTLTFAGILLPRQSAFVCVQYASARDNYHFLRLRDLEYICRSVRRVVRMEPPRRMWALICRGRDYVIPCLAAFPFGYMAESRKWRARIKKSANLFLLTDSCRGSSIFSRQHCWILNNPVD
jgi:hypothetical protein